MTISDLSPGSVSVLTTVLSLTFLIHPPGVSRRGGEGWTAPMDGQAKLDWDSSEGRLAARRSPAMLGITGDSKEREARPAPSRLVLCTRCAPAGSLDRASVLHENQIGGSSAHGPCFVGCAPELSTIQAAEEARAASARRTHKSRTAGN